MLFRTSGADRRLGALLLLPAWLFLVAPSPWMGNRTLPQNESATSDAGPSGEGAAEEAQQLSVDPARLARGLADQAVLAAVVDWLDCDRCQEGQLPRLAKFEDEAVPLLQSALSWGPTPASTELLRRHLVGVYYDLSSNSVLNGRRPLELGGLEAFVDYYLAAADLRVRLRAEIALRRIDTPAARRAYDAAMAARNE